MYICMYVCMDGWMDGISMGCVVHVCGMCGACMWRVWYVYGNIGGVYAWCVCVCSMCVYSVIGTNLLPSPERLIACLGLIKVKSNLIKSRQYSTGGDRQTDCHATHTPALQHMAQAGHRHLIATIPYNMDGECHPGTCQPCV